MSKKLFFKEIQEKPISFLVSKWIVDRVPFIFENDLELYIEWKKDLADKLNVDSKAMTFVGSSGCGFSLNPGKNYKDFNETSDIDLAIISQYHFDIAWRFLRDLGSLYYTLSQKQKNSVEEHKKRFIYWGTIATDKILEILPYGKEWVLILEEKKKDNPVNGRDINIRLYRDFESLRAYQKMNFEKLRQNLLLSV